MIVVPYPAQVMRLRDGGQGQIFFDTLLLYTSYCSILYQGAGDETGKYSKRKAFLGICIILVVILPCPEATIKIVALESRWGIKG
jgi:hypothetical protein